MDFQPALNGPETLQKPVGYYGVAIWKAWPGDIWDPGPLVLLASLGATSLVNVWVQAILGSGVSLGSRTIECGQ